MSRWFTPLHLHALNFFVRRDEFISDLHHQLKRYIGLFQCDHRPVDVLCLASQQRINGLASLKLRVVAVMQTSPSERKPTFG